jgi:threonine aldolase
VSGEHPQRQSTAAYVRGTGTRVGLPHGLALHLDGARLFNAAVELSVPVRELARPFDTVSVCLSKGLGAPVGSVLAGTRVHIEKARRWRKVLRGGMRQADLLAAAGLYALRNHVERLRDDHDNAGELARGLRKIARELRKIERLRVDGPYTNMVFVYLGATRTAEFRDGLKRKGILITNGSPLRLVTHLDIQRDDVRTFLAEARSIIAGG